MKTIALSEALYFYDGLQVFAARDAIGGAYVGILVPSPDEAERYLVVGVAPANLHAFSEGDFDLRKLVTERPNSEWFFATRAGSTRDFALQTQPDLIPEDLLPSVGFVLPGRKPMSETVVEAKARNNLVLQIAVNPPEAVQHRILADHYGRLLTLVQALVKQAYGYAVRNLSEAGRNEVEHKDAFVLAVFKPAAAGSFRFALESVSDADLFGSRTELARALRQVDDLFRVANDVEATIIAVSKARGHFAGSYVRLLQHLADTKSGLRYEWCEPSSFEANRFQIDEGQIAPLMNALSAINNLGTETISIVGTFEKIDTTAGSWRIREDSSKKGISGKSRDGSPSLGGVTTETKRYRIVCEEVIEQEVGSGRETRIFYLNELTEL